MAKALVASDANTCTYEYSEKKWQGFCCDDGKQDTAQAADRGHTSHSLLQSRGLAPAVHTLCLWTEACASRGGHGPWLSRAVTGGSAQCGIPLRGQLCPGAPGWPGRESASSEWQPDGSLSSPLTGVPPQPSSCTSIYSRRTQASTLSLTNTGCDKNRWTGKGGVQGHERATFPVSLLGSQKPPKRTNTCISKATQ